MAIALDSTGAQDSSSNATTHNFTVVNTAGTFMLVGISTDNVAVSGVTYNGVAMASIGSATGGTTLDVYVFGLSNPATGSHTLAVTLGASDKCTIAFTTFTGAGGTTTTDTNNIAQDTANFSTTLTLTSGQWIVGFAGTRGGTDNTAVVTGTERAESGGGAADGNRTMNCATNDGTGSVSVTWSRGASTVASYVGVILIEPINASATATLLTLTMNVNAPSASITQSVTNVLSLTLSLNSPTATVTAHPWSNTSKNTETFSNTSKSSASWSNASKSSSSWSNQDKT